MDTILIVLVFVASIAIGIDVVFVRRRAAAETKALHVALAVVAEHLQALGSVNDAWAILESAPGYMVVRDREAKITYVTVAAANMMNTTPAKLIGSTSVTLKDKQAGTKTLDDFNRLALLSGKPQPGEINYSPPGTSEVWRMEFHISPLRDKGKIVGTITVLTNISNIYTSRW